MIERPSDGYTVRAVLRAAQLLELLRSSNGGATLQELTSESGLAKASVFRMLRTLEQTLLVERVPGTGSYRLGVRCLELGQAYLEQVELRREALPAMERLRAEFNETVHLGVLDDDLRVVYLEQLEGGHAVGIMTARVGRTAPPYCTAVGKALLASRSDDPVALLQQKRALQRWTENTICDPSLLRAELELTRERGYALDREEHERGVKCVGVAVRGPEGALAAISVAGPAHRMPDRLITSRLAPALMTAAREVGGRLGAVADEPGSSARTPERNDRPRRQPKRSHEGDGVMSRTRKE